MSKLINIANDKQRNAEVLINILHSKSNVEYVTGKGEKVSNKRYIKSVSDRSIKALLEKFESPNALADELISSDPEIDFELTGKFQKSISKVYINSEEQVVYKIKKKEFVYLPDGTLKEEREPRYLEANISKEDPVKWSGKLFPKKSIYNKFLFIKKYQLTHTNGLTYDFLFDIAKTLHDSESLMLIGSGPKGLGPLVFNDGGNPYRAFLEGRVQENKYCLILHISNLELKPIPTNGN
jgi:hypothetical protein